MATNGTYYFDTASFDNATTLYTDVALTVVANNGLTVNATNAGGTVAIAGATTSGNVKMQATIIREG